MGSTAADWANDGVTVLITGFGPFKAEYPKNPSWEIVRDLPKFLPPVRAKSAGAPGPVLPKVRLLVHPEPIKVSYTTVRDMVPKLWDLDGTEYPDRPKIDLTIHVGMAGPKQQFVAERRGHRDGYAMKDVDGEFLRDQERRTREGKNWIWHGLPKELVTDLDLDDVLKRWKAHCPPGRDVKISEDAGNYLCDFIYFSSLAHLHKAGEKRNVVFLHVSCDCCDENVAAGKEVVLQLVRSIVESELTRQGTLQAPKGKKS